MSPLVGLLVVCAVNPESPLPSTSSFSSIYRHHRDFFKYFPMIPFQDELGLASANFHEIWNVTGQKSLWPVSGWEARAGETLCIASFSAARSGKNGSATILQTVGLLEVSREFLAWSCGRQSLLPALPCSAHFLLSRKPAAAA